MLGAKGKIIVAVLLFAVVALTGRARLVLDDMTASFRDDFREMNYLPRGNALKIIACGFDTPLADALYVKSLLYFADSFHVPDADKTSRRDYLYDLFDVITELSPRFTRAYQNGSLFLSSSPAEKSNHDAIRLLEKGIERYAAMAGDGNPVVPDGRWLFHTVMATIYETNIQTNRRLAGDIEGALDARQKTAAEFRLGAESPDAPDYLLRAAQGYEQAISGTGNPEDVQAAMLPFLEEMLERAKRDGNDEVAAGIEKSMTETSDFVNNIRETRRMEERLGDLGRTYLARRGEPAASIEDLLRQRFIPGVPPSPLGTAEVPDTWLTLPDGRVKSKLLAHLETTGHLDTITTSMTSYLRVHSTPPKDLETLVRESYLDSLPRLPLEQLGQEYSYDPGTGNFSATMPEGPEPPPAPLLQ